eukprot:2517259-Pyramimonas_sp.AAC.1
MDSTWIRRGSDVWHGFDTDSGAVGLATAAVRVWPTLPERCLRQRPAGIVLSERPLHASKALAIVFICVCERAGHSNSA